MPSEESSQLYMAKSTGNEINPWPPILDNVRMVKYFFILILMMFRLLRIETDKNMETISNVMVADKDQNRVITLNTIIQWTQ